MRLAPPEKQEVLTPMVYGQPDYSRTSNAAALTFERGDLGSGETVLRPGGTLSCSSPAVGRDRPPSLMDARQRPGRIHRHYHPRALCARTIPSWLGSPRRRRLKDILPASVSAKSAMIPADPCRRTQRTL